MVSPKSLRKLERIEKIYMGQRDGTVNRVLVLHATDPSLNLYVIF